MKLQVSVLLFICLSACSKLPFTEKVWIKKNFSYDVRALSDQFSGRNPIGFLISDVGDNNVKLCTSFAVDNHRIVTNNHCVSVDNKSLISPSKMNVLFRNPGDSKATSFRIKRVIASKFHSADKVSQKSSYSNEDYAIIETENSLSKFGAVPIADNAPSIDALRNDLEVEIYKINPPRESDTVATLEIAAATVKSFDLFIDFPPWREQEKRKEDCLRARKKAVAECESITYSYSDFYQDFKNGKFKSNLVEISNADFRHGNSGSPVLLSGSAIGLMHAMWLRADRNKSDREESSSGIMQWLLSISHL